jgi:hypothetical protein
LTAALLISTAVPATSVAKEKLPEVSSDGLHLTKQTKSRIVYVKPGATLDKYSKVMLLDCYVDFVKNWQRDYNLDEVGLDGRVTDKDAEEIKKRLADEFAKVFKDELTKKGYPVVGAAGPGVLLLRPALLNVDVAAPDLMNPRREWTLVQSAGSATLYLELYDSATSTLLARVIDAEADPNDFAQQANRVTNTSAADRILRRWADELATHLAAIQK